MTTRRSPVQLLAAASALASHLVGRPGCVVHLYVGPLTPSGRRVPRAGRTVCGTRTRQLHVLVDAAADLATRRRAACARCTRLLVSRGERCSRHDAATRYADVAPFDLALWAYLATDLADVELVEWLVLVLVGFPACTRDAVVAPTGKTTGALDSHTRRARIRLGLTDDLHDRRAANAATASARAEHNKRAASHDSWNERQARIERLGIANAVP